MHCRFTISPVIFLASKNISKIIHVLKEIQETVQESSNVALRWGKRNTCHLMDRGYLLHVTYLFQHICTDLLAKRKLTVISAKNVILPHKCFSA